MFTQEIAYSTAYLAGVASFFSPCIFPIIPVYISILSNGEKKSLSKTLAFVLGLSVTYIILGFGAGVIGDLFLDDKVRIIGGIIVMILGLLTLGTSVFAKDNIVEFKTGFSPAPRYDVTPSKKAKFSYEIGANRPDDVKKFCKLGRLTALGIAGFTFLFLYIFYCYS